jgi:hypothetical protein
VKWLSFGKHSRMTKVHTYTGVYPCDLIWAWLLYFLQLWTNSIINSLKHSFLSVFSTCKLRKIRCIETPYIYRYKIPSSIRAAFGNEENLTKRRLTFQKNFSLPPWCKWSLRSSGLLHSLLLIWLLHLSHSFTLFWFHFYYYKYGCVFCVGLFTLVNVNFYYYVYVCLLLCLYILIVMFMYSYW